MLIKDLFESLGNQPLIIVDVQPEYQNYIHFKMKNFTKMLNTYPGKILMLVNAEETGISRDTKDEILQWYLGYGLKENVALSMKIYDKGYGYMRAWMDFGIDDDAIIRVGQLMNQHGIDDSRDLEKATGQTLEEILGNDYDQNCEDDALNVNFVEERILQQYDNALICGGGRHECLKEVMLLMDILSLKYQPLEAFIY
jgi:hypothetical protein